MPALSARWDWNLVRPVAFYSSSAMREEIATVQLAPLSYQSQAGNDPAAKADRRFMMMHVAGLVFGSDEVFSNFGLWAFLSVGAVAMFAMFIPLTTWMDTRRKEREAYYKAEMIRRVAESSGDGAKAAMEMMREDARQKRIRTLEGLKVGGVINVFVGVALIVFLRVLLGGGAGSPFLCGLIPGLIGVAMLVYVFTLARPVE